MKKKKIKLLINNKADDLLILRDKAVNIIDKAYYNGQAQALYDVIKLFERG